MRSFFNGMLKSVSEFFNKLSKKARVRLLVLIAVVIVFAVVMVVILNRTQYLPLMTASSPAEAGEIYTALQNMNVPVIVEGNTVLVPDKRVNELKIILASDGFFTNEVDYSSYFDMASGFAVTDDLRQKIYEAACQSEIRAQILLSDKITQALVKVNMGKTSAFAITRDAREPTCSVTFTLKSGASFSNQEAQTIADIVKASIQGISYENISIQDSKLKHYTVGDGAIDIGTELQTRLVLQNALEEQIQMQGIEFFNPVFGVHNVKVQAHVVLDFDSVSEESIEFFPPIEGQMGGIVRSSSQLYELQRMVGAVEGPPGTDTNGMGATEYPYEDIRNDENYIRSLDEFNYEINQTIRTIEKERGAIKELSISILINNGVKVYYLKDGYTSLNVSEYLRLLDEHKLPAIGTDEFDLIYPYIESDIPDDMLEQVRDLAAKAFGCAPANISVQRMPFAEREKTAEEIAAEWEAIENQLRKRKLMETIIIWAVILILGLAFMALVRSIVKNTKEPEESESTALAGVGGIDYLADGSLAEEDLEEFDEDEDYLDEDEQALLLNAKSPGLEQIEKFIDSDPAAVASLLRNWLADEE